MINNDNSRKIVFKNIGELKSDTAIKPTVDSAENINSMNTELITEKTDDAEVLNNSYKYQQYCTACGAISTKSKKCPSCGLKNHKNYKKHCRYCGGNIDLDKKCVECGTLARNSVMESVVRIFIKVHMLINYLVVFFCWIAFDDIAVSSQFIMFKYSVIILIVTVLIHNLLFKKKAIQKIKLKLFHKKKKRRKLVLIYLAIIIGLNSVYTFIPIGFVAGGVLIENKVMENNYKKAQKNISSGNYTEAYKLLSDDNYECSNLLISGMFPQYKQEISNCKIGDTIYLGRYRHQYSGQHKNDTIQWKVVDVKNGRALLISTYILDSEYKGEDFRAVVNMNWENGEIREWLNSYFIDESFLPIEQEIIESTTLINDKYLENGKRINYKTKDKIFLLSIDEVNEYFRNDEDRKCIPTEYARDNGGVQNYNSYWYLRSYSLRESLETACVTKDGTVGFFDNHTRGGIRPAMWINLK